MHPSILPISIKHLINEYVCEKKHNDKPSTHGLVIGVDVDFNLKITPDVEDAISKWLYTCLDCAHRNVDFGTDWHYVYNIKHDQWRDYDEAYGIDEKKNSIQVAVHFQQRDTCQWPLFVENGTRVHPCVILEHLHSAPTYIHRIGVSGVSERCLREQWWEIISPDTDGFDRKGKGYMQHPMWTLVEKDQDGTLGTDYASAPCMREQSYRFQWDCYPPSLLNENIS